MGFIVITQPGKTPLAYGDFPTKDAAKEWADDYFGVFDIYEKLPVAEGKPNPLAQLISKSLQHRSEKEKQPSQDAEIVDAEPVDDAIT